MRRFGLLVTSGTLLFVLLLAGLATDDPRLGIGLALVMTAGAAVATLLAPVLTRTRLRRFALCAVTAALHLVGALHAFRSPELPGARWFGVGGVLAAAFWALLALLLVRSNPGPPKGMPDEPEPDPKPSSAGRADGRSAGDPAARRRFERDGAVPTDRAAATRVPGR